MIRHIIMKTRLRHSYLARNTVQIFLVAVPINRIFAKGSGINLLIIFVEEATFILEINNTKGTQNNSFISSKNNETDRKFNNLILPIART